MQNEDTLSGRRQESISIIHNAIAGAKILAFELDVSHRDSKVIMKACLSIEGGRKLIYDMDTGHITFEDSGRSTSGETDASTSKPRKRNTGEKLMKLSEFLQAVGDEASAIINYVGEEALKAVKQDGDALKYVKDQTPEICTEAVKRNGYALKYVKDQTPEICTEAVKRNGYALRYVKDQTPEICTEAVKRNGYALKYVKDQTPEICTEAVKRNGYALRYVKDQTPEICTEAVKRNGYALRYVKDQTPEICTEAVKQDGDALKYVNKSIFEPDGNTKTKQPCPRCNGTGIVEEA